MSLGQLSGKNLAKKKGSQIEKSVTPLLLGGAYRNRTDDLLTARDNTGFSTGLHYTLLHYITNIMYSCFSYILHLFSVTLAKKLANCRFSSYRASHFSIQSLLNPIGLFPIGIPFAIFQTVWFPIPRSGTGTGLPASKAVIKSGK